MLRFREDPNVISAHVGLGMIYNAQQGYDKAKGIAKGFKD
jgi:hypothetical protein